MSAGKPRKKYVSSRSQRPILPTGTTVAGFEIRGLLGRGGFSDVYEASSPTGEIYALKTEFLDARKQALARETDFLEKISGSCFPRVYARGETTSVRYLVMNKLGPSILDLKREFSNCLPAKTVLFVAIEALKVIEQLHNQGFIHRDIKPSNFLINNGGDYHLALIDFGLATPYINFDTGEHLPQESGHFCGTGRYASVNALMKLGVSRRDDVISWFYSLMELLHGKLPWQRHRDHDELLAAKTRIDPDVLCRCHQLAVSTPLRVIYSKISALGYDEKPEYDVLIELVMECLRVNYGFVSPTFDWSTLTGLREDESVGQVCADGGEERPTISEREEVNCKCDVI